ncbi:MAG: DUF1801 domain-containing protein [Candidatus Devosia phytovorans]|uniref:DUF1801 domain-containing protein n=1 Tax=Candidatus Devosia phytovorans TaxID=3121372 RepID=A0AAJ5VTS4_9HYPH|nr:DUF1801 domain-containing protein [Devosia sp.]WEK03184.1 MAG: DUF1801 domain-containing protein [Devosia sp.]
MTPSEQIDAYIAALADWRGPMLSRVRKAFLAADPGVTEHFKYKGSPVWECDGQLAVGNAHAGKVKLTLARGASLDDPDRLFNNGNGKVWKAIDIFESDTLDEKALIALVQRAVAFNRAKKAK